MAPHQCGTIQKDSHLPVLPNKWLYTKGVAVPTSPHECSSVVK